MTTPAPGGRPRDAAARREEILRAARDLFLKDSYENVGVRDVAAAAGVDAALVCRYSGSKEELFAEVLACCGDPDVLFAGPREGFGARVATILVDDPVEAGKLDGLLIMLRSASSPKAGEMIRESIETRFHAPLVEWLGGAEAPARARMIGIVAIGASLTRALNETFGLDEEGRAALRARVARELQALVDG